MAKPKEGDIQFSTLLPLEAYHALCWRKHQLQVRSGATVKLREVLLDELQPLIEDYRKTEKVDREEVLSGTSENGAP